MLIEEAGLLWLGVLPFIAFFSGLIGWRIAKLWTSRSIKANGAVPVELLAPILSPNDEEKGAFCIIWQGGVFYDDRMQTQWLKICDALEDSVQKDLQLAVTDLIEMGKAFTMTLPSRIMVCGHVWRHFAFVRGQPLSSASVPGIGHWDRGAIPLPSWQRDLEGRIIKVNHAFRKLWQISADVISLPDFWAFEDWRDVVASNLRKRGDFYQQQLTLPIHGQDYLLDLYEWVAEDGYIYGMAVDISAQSVLQSQITNLHNGQEALRKHLPIGIMLIDRRGYLSDCNLALRKLLPLPEEYWQQPLRLTDWLQALRDTKLVTDTVSLSMLPDGVSVLKNRWGLPDQRTLDVTMIDLSGDTGQMLLIEDITKHISLEQTLHNRHRTQRCILQTLDEGILALAPDGCIQFVNDRLPILMGVDADSLSESHNIHDIAAIWPENGDVRQFWKKFLQSPWQDGQELDAFYNHAEHCIQPFVTRLPDGQYLIRFRDITVDKRWQMHLQERARIMVLSEQAKHDFMMSIARNLRNPLNVITGFTQILHAKQGELDPYFDHILKASHLMQSYIDDIVDCVDRQEFDVHSADQVAIGLFCTSLRNILSNLTVPVKITCLVADDELLTLAEPAMLRQAFIEAFRYIGKQVVDKTELSLVFDRTAEGEWHILLSGQWLEEGFARDWRESSWLSLLQSVCHLHQGRMDIRQQDNIAQINIYIPSMMQIAA